MATVKPTSKPSLPFGKPSQITKFGGERLKPEQLPQVHLRELVMIGPTGRCRIFSSTPDQADADAALKPIFGQTFVELLTQGWISIGNHSVYLPTVTISKGRDMPWPQLDAFRKVLARYEHYLATVIVRAYSPIESAYEHVGRFRTIKAAEQGARGV